MNLTIKNAEIKRKIKMIVSYMTKTRYTLLKYFNVKGNSALLLIVAVGNYRRMEEVRKPIFRAK